MGDGAEIGEIRLVRSEYDRAGSNQRFIDRLSDDAVTLRSAVTVLCPMESRVFLRLSIIIINPPGRIGPCRLRDEDENGVDACQAVPGLHDPAGSGVVGAVAPS